MRKIFGLFVWLLLLWANHNLAQVGSAMVNLEQGKLDKAKEAIDKAIQNEKDAQKSKTWFVRGEVYSAIAQSPIPNFANLDKNAARTALQAYRKAMELEPNQKGYYKDAENAIKTKLYACAINQGANLYNAKEKDLANALIAFEVAHEANPTDTIAVTYASAVAWEAKNYDKFLQYAEKIEKMNFSPATKRVTKIQIAYLYAERKNIPKALEVLEEAIKQYPNDKQIWGLAAELYEQQVKSGGTNNLIEFYERAVKQFPNDADFWKLLGFAYWNKAVEVEKEIRKKKEAEGLTGELKDPKKQQKAREYNNIVDAEIKKAIPPLEKADQLKPNDFDTMDLLRACYETLGMKDKKAEMDKKIKAIGKE
ncbi:MAG: tetratricopeptide repeat protein [Raineya sp.]|nr:tetratricopeptide repeat protein [Raineya sp.]